MDNLYKIAIIIPCFNEESRLRQESFIKVAREHINVSFIFVNDCSKDKTEEIINNLCAIIPNQFIPIHLYRNHGKAGAVREGFLKAFSENFSVIGYWDADLSTPLSELENLLKSLKDSNCSFVLGSRIRLVQYHIERKMIRHYLGRTFATFASLILGFPIYDTQCGAKLFQNSQELKKVFGQPFSTNWIFDIEILARFVLISRYSDTVHISKRISEIPLKEWKDVPGSKVRIIDFILAAYELLYILWLLRGTKTLKYYNLLIKHKI